MELNCQRVAIPLIPSIIIAPGPRVFTVCACCSRSECGSKGSWHIGYGFGAIGTTGRVEVAWNNLGGKVVFERVLRVGGGTREGKCNLRGFAVGVVTTVVLQRRRMCDLRRVVMSSNKLDG